MTVTFSAHAVPSLELAKVQLLEPHAVSEDGAIMFALAGEDGVVEHRIWIDYQSAGSSWYVGFAGVADARSDPAIAAQLEAVVLLRAAEIRELIERAQAETGLLDWVRELCAASEDGASRAA